MRRDLAILVEGVLRDFPRINSDRVLREQWLEVMAVSPGGPSDRTDGGTFKPTQDRFLQAMDETFLKKLQRIVRILHDAYINLDETEKRVVALSCFDNMNNASVGVEINANYRYVQRLKASSFEKMRRACTEVIIDVEDWREREQIELSKQISLLSQA